jgi:hypothetical protein
MFRFAPLVQQSPGNRGGIGEIVHIECALFDRQMGSPRAWLSPCHTAPPWHADEMTNDSGATPQELNTGKPASFAGNSGEQPHGIRRRLAPLKLLPVPLKARYSEPDYYVWCGSMVRAPDGICRLFYSRWLKSAGFGAWASHSEIAHATAPDPLGPYIHQGVALRERESYFWDGLCTHNPTVITHGGKYYLYYMGCTGDRKPAENPEQWNWMHRNNQRIGVAVADNPEGPWRRSDLPLIDVGNSPGSSDGLLVNNPTVSRRPDGGFLMIYKAVGRRDSLPFGGPVVHRIALAEDPEGPFVKLPDPVFTRHGSNFPAEDPFVWWENGRYRAILKDMHGAFTPAGRALVLFESPDGVDWNQREPLLLSDRTVEFEDGSREQFDYLERPQVYCQNGRASVLFCAARKGAETWNLHIPLDAGADGR